MKEEFVKCSYCRADVTAEACKLAAHRRVIDGKQYVFCCVNCADRFEKKGSKRQ